MLISGLRSAASEPPAAAPGIWPLYRGDLQRSGRSPYRGPEHLRVRWQVDLEREVCTPPAVDAEGIVYTGSGASCHAVSPDGELLWSLDLVEAGLARTDGSANGMRQAYTSPGPALGPEGVLYQTAGLRGQGWVLAIDIRPPGPSAPAAEERLLWSHATGQEMRSAPLFAGGLCYVGDRVAGMLRALDAGGELAWAPGDSTLHSTTSSPALSHDGATLYLGGPDGRLHAFDAASGEKRWSAGPEERGGLRPAERDEAGRTTRRFTTAGHVPEAPAVGPDGTVYFGSWDGHLYAADPEGQLRWRIDLGDRLSSAPAVCAEGRVLAGSYDGFLFAVREREGRPTLEWSAEAACRYSSPLISADGKVYVGGMDGRLRAFAVEDGTPMGELELGGWIHATPVPGGDGLLYVGASDGWLRAIE